MNKFGFESIVVIAVLLALPYAAFQTFCFLSGRTVGGLGVFLIFLAVSMLVGVVAQFGKLREYVDGDQTQP